MDMEEQTLRYRRREGLPLSWEQLTEKQLKAVRVIAELLMDALTSIKPSGTTKVGDLDPDRRSQMAFIDGDRGMGKSSVLLTIHSLLLGNQLGKIEDPVVNLLRESRDRFVWLETLDMEPLPRHANILAAIMARISDKATPPGGDNEAPRMALAFDGLEHYEKTIMKLNDLQSTAVLAWAGIVPGRGAQIDSSAYASEVLACEKAILNLNPRLGLLLNDLAKLRPATGRWDDPIFIVPVDDFDLAPTRCLELLRIVRMVATPRLFFLVAGNTRIAEDALRLQIEGDLAALAGETMARMEANIIRERGIEIAANNLRKLVPPQQRALLAEMRIDEALMYRVEKNGQTLGQVLEEIKFTRNIAAKKDEAISLYKFLLLEESNPPISYSGAVWLGGTPRQVLDRMVVFSRHRGLQEYYGDRIVRAISAELNREVLEDGRLRYDQREIIRSVVDIEEDIQFDFARVFRLRIERDYRQNEILNGGVLRLQYPKPALWFFRASEDVESGLGQALAPELRVPRRIAAGLTFLHDLAISLWGGYVLYPSILYQTTYHFSPVEIQWESLQGMAPINWLFPEWWTLREYEIFFRYWRERAVNCHLVDDLASAWLASQLEVLLDLPFERERKGTDVERIGTLLVLLAREEPTRWARQFLRKKALTAIVLLLAPESGVSSEFATKIYEVAGKAFECLDKEIIEDVRSQRAFIFSEGMKVLRLSERHVYYKAIQLLLGWNYVALIEMTWGDFRMEYEKLHHNGLININNGKNNIVEMIRDIIISLRKAKASNIINAKSKIDILAKNLNLLKNNSVSIGANIDEFRKTLDILTFVLEAYHSDKPHFINDWQDGKLVPTTAEIEKFINIQPPQRGNR